MLLYPNNFMDYPVRTGRLERLETMIDHTESLKLKDGSEVTIREKTMEDLEESIAFYKSLPQEEQELMRLDVSDREQVIQRLREIDTGHTEHLIAVHEGKIVGESTLENLRYGWMRKTGEIRILFLPQYRKMELAEVLARETFLHAARRGLNNLIARVLDGENDMLDIFKKIHFRHEATQKDHAVDRHGKTHDIFLLTFSLSRMWQDMEESIRSSRSIYQEH